MKLYGAHPFSYRKWFRQWELHLEVKFDIEIVNPFYDLAREDIKAIDEGLMNRYEADHNTLVDRDLEAISDCEGVIAIINGDGSYGTPMELVYAHNWSKTVHAIIMNGHENHPWLKYHSDYIYTSLEQFEKEFNHYL